MTDMPALLEARGLRKHLGGRPIVNGVDLVCHAGQVLGLLGPNGTGAARVAARRGRRRAFAGLAVLVAVMLVVLVPLDMRLLRKRVLGD